MDTKVLYVTAVVIAAISGGYYYYSGKGKKLDGNSAQSMTYSAEGIQLVQTDEKGNLYVRAQVDHLEQDLQRKTSKLSNLNASMFNQNQVDSTFLPKKQEDLMTMRRLFYLDRLKQLNLVNVGRWNFKQMN